MDPLEARQPYRIERSDSVLRRLNEIGEDVNLRLVRRESRDALIDRTAQEIADRGVRVIEQELVPRATQLGQLIQSYRDEGIPADSVIESSVRQFLSGAAIADLQARPTVAQVAALILSELDKLAIPDIDDLVLALDGKATPADLDARGAPAAGSVRMGQFRRALEASGVGRVGEIMAAVPPDPGDSVNIAWADGFVTPGGTLATVVAATLALTPGQMTALFTSARTQPN